MILRQVLFYAIARVVEARHNHLRSHLTALGQGLQEHFSLLEAIFLKRPYTEREIIRQWNTFRSAYIY